MTQDESTVIACKGCGRPLPQHQVRIMNRPGNNPWFREGYCSYYCFQEHAESPVTPMSKTSVGTHETIHLKAPPPVTPIWNDWGSATKTRYEQVGGSRELNNYTLNPSFGRKGLNVTMAIGCVLSVGIIGFAIEGFAFEGIGEKSLGKRYFWILSTCGFIAIVCATNNLRVLSIALVLLYYVIYVCGWTYANIILSGHQANARQRIASLDQLSKDQITIDDVLEKGVIQARVLRDHKAASATFAQTVQMPGGDAQLLNLAGVILFSRKQFTEAKHFFDVAISSTKDQAILKQIQANQAAVEKSLAKQKVQSMRGC